jgi:hypothetical protein
MLAAPIAVLAPPDSPPSPYPAPRFRMEWRLRRMLNSPSLEGRNANGRSIGSSRSFFRTSIRVPGAGCASQKTQSGSNPN